MCIEGTIAARDESTAFPLGPEIQARLTVSWKTFEKLSHICKRCTLSSLIHTDRCPQVIINTALVNSLDLDHRVVPWDTVRSRAVLVSILHQVSLHFALAESSTKPLTEYICLRRRPGGRGTLPGTCCSGPDTQVNFLDFFFNIITNTRTHSHGDGEAPGARQPGRQQSR